MKNDKKGIYNILRISVEELVKMWSWFEAKHCEKIKL